MLGLGARTYLTGPLAPGPAPSSGVGLVLPLVPEGEC
jgi:hypothetical protein